jgi:hypothetical protein
VNPEATLVRERVADPVGVGAVLHDNDNAAPIVEIPHWDAAPLTRATANGFDDEGVFPGVWRPWDADEQGEIRDRVRDPHELLRKSHTCTRVANVGVNREQSGAKRHFYKWY